MRYANKKRGLKGLYSRSWKYICDSKNYIYSVIGFFVLFILVGLFVPVPAELEAKLLEYISELLAKTEGLSQGGLIRFIFLNNVQSSFFGMIFGVFFGIFPLISSLVNGYVIGFVLSKAIEIEGVLTILRLVPHGVFELPALFISLGVGLKLGWSFGVTVVGGVIEGGFVKKFKQFREDVLNSLLVFVLVVVPLLIIAAIIEGTLIFVGR